MNYLNRGILIVIEGIDGSGKSLLAQNLTTALKKQFSVLLTKEPGGSMLGRYLRTVVQEKKLPMCPKAECLLFAADRAQHFDEVIVPALAQKNLIISDRMSDSSLVYQGFGRGLDLDKIKEINAWAMNTIVPDITFYVRIDAQTARDRLTTRGNLSSFDQESLEFFQKLIDGFEQLYKNRTDVFILNGTLSPDTLVEQAKEKLLEWTTKNKIIP